MEIDETMLNVTGEGCSGKPLQIGDPIDKVFLLGGITA